MKQNKKTKGDFVMPFPTISFHHKHLSLQKQRKDKEIKQQRQQLQKKRKEFQETKGKWIKQDIQFKMYTKNRKQQNIRLVLQEEKLKTDLFRLTIRRDQIESRKKPEITIMKANIIKKYLKCAPYTAGNRLESIKFWKSQARYNQLKFLLELALDRYFGRSPIQKSIIGNLSRIVLCKKVKFESRWIMLCIKQTRQQSSNYCYKTCKKSHRNLYHPENSNSTKHFEVIVYAITGTPFQASKLYTSEQLKEWVYSSKHNIIDHQNTITRPILNNHRLSVADNLAKINALKQISEQFMATPQLFVDRSRKESFNSFKDQRYRIISQEAAQSLHNSEPNQQIDENTTYLRIQNKKKVSNSNQESESSKDPTSENLSDVNQSYSQTNNIRGGKTRKSMISKSSFYLKGKNSSNICKFNRQFLKGVEEILFPEQNPILNLIILKDEKDSQKDKKKYNDKQVKQNQKDQQDKQDTENKYYKQVQKDKQGQKDKKDNNKKKSKTQKRELYFLREYISRLDKKPILDKVVARFRLKMKIKAEQKRCLYYKIATVQSCYETVMGQEESIYLPCLFVLKTHQTDIAHQIYIYCDSLKYHPKIQNGLQIKALLHQALKDKQETKQSKPTRTSNIKNSKNTGQRRSRQSKRRPNLRNPSRNLAIQQHEKSAFVLVKRKIQPWTAFSPEIIEKYNNFMSNHVISIQKRQFLTRQWVKNRIFGIVRIQNKIRSIISKRRLKEAQLTSKFKCTFKANLKILFTAVLSLSSKAIKVYIETLQMCNSAHDDNLQPINQMVNKELARTADYSQQYWDAICQSFDHFSSYGSFQQVADTLFKTIQQNIALKIQKKEQLQREKPQRYKKRIKNFFFMITLRNKVRKNIFFVKKVIMKQRIFILLIRRDKYMKSLLECNLYDLILQKGKQDPRETKNSQTAFSKQQKEVGSEYGSHRPASRSKPELDDKIYRYQKIFLMEQYFENIDPKRIMDEFYIDKGVFLLKPPKTFNIFFIERLGVLDLNSEQFSKEFLIYEKEENSLKVNEERVSLNVSNKSLKRLIHRNISDKTQKTDKNQTQSRQLLNISELKARKQSKQNSRKDKKTSIQKNEREKMTFLKSNFMRDHTNNIQMISKKSFGQSNSGKGRQYYLIKNNGHQSTVFYSLYKSENVFFNLQFFIVLKTLNDSGYHETLFSIRKYRLYKKQLEQSSISLYYKKLAAWAHQNQDQFIKVTDNSKQKSEQICKKDETFQNLVTLEFFNALISGNKRFSFDVKNTLPSQKGPRTNTLTL